MNNQDRLPALLFVLFSFGSMGVVFFTLILNEIYKIIN